MERNGVGSVGMLTHRFALAGLASLALAAAAGAQTGTIVGTVTDRSSSAPVSDVRVQVGTSTLGASTDPRGRYVIRNVPVGQQALRVTRIGFRPENATAAVVANDSVRVDIAMAQSAVELAAVVTTGTGGAVEKRKLGSSIGTVDMAEVQERLPVTDLGSALSAKVAGLRSVSGGGGVGAAKDLRIRGIASFTLNQRPVVYIDGVKVDTRATEWTDNLRGAACCSFSGGAATDRLNDINPSDIERVEVLKGAAAATLYGSEASNGVIQIFTKRGKNESRPVWNVGLTSGYTRLRENLPTKLFPRFVGTDGTRAHDANELIDNGLHQNYDMSVQGGGNRNTYFISGSFLDDQGSIQPNWEKKGNLRLNLTFLPTDKWTIEARSLYTRNKIAEQQAGNNWSALIGNAINGDPRKATKLRPYGEAWIPVSDIQKIETTSDANRWTGGVTMSYAMRPNFTHRFTAGMDAVNDQKARFYPFGYDYGAAGVNSGQKNLAYRNYRVTTLDYLGQLNLKLFKNIGSDFSFGTQGLWENDRQNIANGLTFAGPGVSSVATGATRTGDENFVERINIGFFAQNRFSFGDKLFSTIGARMDGNSAFGDNFGFKTYPKADIAWVFSEYGVLPQWLSTGKLRSAIGQSGKAPGAFDQFTTFATRSVFTGTPGVVPDNPGNADLKPETTTEFELGLDLGFMGDRLGVEATMYRSSTKDAIVNQPNPPSAGFQSSRSTNVGEIQNRGWEASVNYVVLQRRKFDWSTQVRVDGNKNEVTELGTFKPTDNNIRLGYPVRGVWARYKTGYSKDKDGKPVFTRSDTAKYFGSPLPTFNGSFGNTFRYGSFTLYGLLTMERGAVFSNGDRPYRVRQGGSDEYLQFLQVDAAGKATTTFSADSTLAYWNLFDAIDSRDNVRLREISLAYAVPSWLSNRAGVGRTTISLSGQNVQWWDHCHCVDPNMNYQPGQSFAVTSGFLGQASPKTYRVSIRTSF
jgi:TonB-dependent starch-binding outer membrane protein SusC